MEAQLAALRAALGEKQREVAAGRADLERRQALLRSAAGAPLQKWSRRCWSWRLCSSSNAQSLACVSVWAWSLARVRQIEVQFSELFNAQAKRGGRCWSLQLCSSSNKSL